MNLTTIKTAIIGRVGRRTDLDAFINAEIILAQATLLERNGSMVPWFLETEIATAALVAGEERVELPEDFLIEKEEGGLFLYDAAGAETARWKKLRKMSYDDLLLKYQDQTGDAKAYSLGGRYFRVRPLVTEDKVLKMIYFAEDESVQGDDENFENLWMRYAPDLLIAEVSKVLAEKYLQDFELGGKFDSDINRSWDRVRRETEAQMHTNRLYAMGDEL